MRTRMHTIRALGTLMLLSAWSRVAATQQPSVPDPRALRSAIREHRAAHETAIVRELVELVSIPNVASDSANIRKNAEYLLSMLRRRGIEARLLESPGSPPAVYGQLRTPGARRTIVMYAHYDGQPALGDSRWTSEPWMPVFRDTTGRGVSVAGRATIDPEWRLYARSASDDKAPIIAMLVALDALRAVRQPLSVNVKFFFEGEEEAGSPHLRVMLEQHAELLRADAWIFCDGPVHQSHAGRLRCPWHVGSGDDRLWREPATAQRALRQLGAEPHRAPRPSARQHAPDRRAHPGARLLR